MNYIWVLPPKLWAYRKGDVKFCKVVPRIEKILRHWLTKII